MGFEQYVQAAGTALLAVRRALGSCCQLMLGRYGLLAEWQSIATLHISCDHVCCTVLTLWVLFTRSGVHDVQCLVRTWLHLPTCNALVSIVTGHELYGATQGTQTKALRM